MSLCNLVAGPLRYPDDVLQGLRLRSHSPDAVELPEEWWPERRLRPP